METEDQTLKGRLLVATPGLLDPNFDRAVVLVLEHGAEGALGVVLNRPTDKALDEGLPKWNQLAASPSVVFIGGPVQVGAVICLAEVAQDNAVDGWTPVTGRLGVFDLDRDPDDAAAGLAQIRVFTGYAGWAGGQLEGEIEAGGWIVVDAVHEDALTPNPEVLWRDVLKRQPGTLAMVANFPRNPSMN